MEANLPSSKNQHSQISDILRFWSQYGRERSPAGNEDCFYEMKEQLWELKCHFSTDLHSDCHLV